MSRSTSPSSSPKASAPSAAEEPSSSPAVPDFFAEGFASRAANFFSGGGNAANGGLGQNGELRRQDDGEVAGQHLDGEESGRAGEEIHGFALRERGADSLEQEAQRPPGPTSPRSPRSPRATSPASRVEQSIEGDGMDRQDGMDSEQRSNPSSPDRGGGAAASTQRQTFGSQGAGAEAGAEARARAGEPRRLTSFGSDGAGAGEGRRQTSAEPEGGPGWRRQPSFGGDRASPGGSGRNAPAASTPNMAEEVLHTIAPEDEEGRSRQRILAFAAKRYSAAVERNPEDHDALYNWALVLQESADNAGQGPSGSEPGAASSGKDALLEEACRKYEAATKLCPTLHEAFYNWAIAISDRAKIRGRTNEAEALWRHACERYDRSVQLNWNSPQALNNWGLALQELGGIVPAREKRAVVTKAITKFRAAIRLRFDFHRAVYNLGTVLYGLAEDSLRGTAGPTARPPRRGGPFREPAPGDLYSQSAIYIAAAHALKPDYPVYRSALRLVRSMLPLPYLKAGYLTVPPVGDSLAPHKDWQRLWFVLDHEALYEVPKPDGLPAAHTLAGGPGTPGGSRRASAVGAGEGSSAGVWGAVGSSRASVLRVEMEDLVAMGPSADLSLPPGGGFHVDTVTGPQFVVADTWEEMDGWIDAIRLTYTILARGKQDALSGVLAS